MTYESNRDEVTTHTFTYTVTDAGAVSNIATVTVAINPGQRRIGGPAHDGHHPRDTPVRITFAELVANASDPEGDRVQLLCINGSNTNGSLFIGNGYVDFTPHANVTAPGTFTYSVIDSGGAITFGTVTINITATAAEGGSTTINVLANDTDPDGVGDMAPGSVELTQPVHGQVSMDANGVVTLCVQR